MNSNTRVAGLVALLVLLISAVVYFLTLTPTVPFWDSGEFIGVSTILGIPHPPGTPFYVLVGRMATLVPLGSIAQRVNGLSAVAAALCHAGLVPLRPASIEPLLVPDAGSGCGISR